MGTESFWARSNPRASSRVFRTAQFIKENTVNSLKLEIIVQTVMLFVSVGERDLEFGFMKTSETFFPVKHRVLDGKKKFWSL